MNILRYALNENNVLITADLAQKSKKYTCLQCGENLILRKGEKRIAHFAHYKDAQCNPETLEHKIAKRLIVEAVNKNIRGESIIKLQTKCDECYESLTFIINPKVFIKANEEQTIGKYRCDVVVEKYNGKLGIEILQTHKVDEIKAINLQIPWIELKATDILEDAYTWRIKNSKLNNCLCKSCSTIKAEYDKLANKYGIPSNIYSVFTNSSANYIINKTYCYKCKNEIPVFTWAGTPFAKSEPPQPAPHTIKLRYSDTIKEHYYANICPKCKALQGDFFLYYGKSSIF